MVLLLQKWVSRRSWSSVCDKYSIVFDLFVQYKYYYVTRIYH